MRLRHVNEAMEVRVNGDTLHIASGLSLSDLLRAMEVKQQHVAVEVNAELIPRESHDTHTVQPGDTIEIVTLVGGG